MEQDVKQFTDILPENMSITDEMLFACKIMTEAYDFICDSFEIVDQDGIINALKGVSLADAMSGKLHSAIVDNH